MRLGFAILITGLCLSLPSCRTAMENGKQEVIPPPTAKKIPHRFEKHGHVRIDEYYWLRERENPEVIACLEAENEYTAAATAHCRSLEDSLFAEIKARIKQTDVSVPYKLGDYFYYRRFEKEKEYPVYCRKFKRLEEAEEILLDVNKLAEGHDFVSVGGRAVSSGQDILAYAVDTVGRRIHSIYFKNLDDGILLEEAVPGVTGSLAWANDNKTLLYTRQDPTTLRPYRVYSHTLGVDPAEDKLIYEETDETFSCYVFKSKSKKFLMIGSFQTLSTEYRCLDANNPGGEFKIVLPRESNHEYRVYHSGDKFYIRTNDQANNFRLMETPVANPGKDNWREVVGHREDVLLEGVEAFKDYLVLEERENGLLQIRIIPLQGDGEHYLDFGEPAYLAYTGNNREIDTRKLRFVYTSMTTPESVYDYDMKTREKVLLKQEDILGGFDPDNYRTERLFAATADGVRVPISMVYRKGIEKNGRNPLLLDGYGSYGNSRDASFSSPRLSLIDRSFIYAIAHVRGGEEMGRNWYEDGKLLKKKNTFTDFIACGEYLVSQGYTSPEKMFAIGGSAGGLLIGAVINMRPDLFHGVVAHVPWVDVVTTMLDPGIPLTTSEYDEWGDPNNKEYYDYMLSYSPYDNVQAVDYPHMLVTTGLHDSQVQYWEPAKWVAKIRALKTGSNLLLLKTRMDAGHGGVSGRFKRYREIAFDYAFLLDLAGIKQ